MSFSLFFSFHLFLWLELGEEEKEEGYNRVQKKGDNVHRIGLVGRDRPPLHREYIRSVHVVATRRKKSNNLC